MCRDVGSDRPAMLRAESGWVTLAKLRMYQMSAESGEIVSNGGEM